MTSSPERIGDGGIEVEMEEIAISSEEEEEKEREMENKDVERSSSRNTSNSRHSAYGKGDVSVPEWGTKKKSRRTRKPSFKDAEPIKNVYGEQAVDAAIANEEFNIDPDRAKAKLEVLNSKSIKWMLFWYYLAIVLTFLIMIAWAVVVATKFREEAENLTTFILLKIDLLGSAGVSLIFFFFVLAFVFRIVLLPWKKKNVEMIWTCVMLVGLVICFNPVFYGASAWSILANEEDIQITANGLYVLVASICYEFSTFFYMLCMIKLYGMYTNPKGVKEYVIFYLKVIIPVSVPLLVKLVTGLVLNFRYYYTPFGAIITLLMLAIRGIWETNLYVCVIVSCVLEILLFAYILRSARVTWKQLARVPYAPYRYKQLGFRFFLYHTMTCWFVLSVYDVIVTASTPIDRYINSYYAWKSDQQSQGQLQFDDATFILGQSYAFFPVILLISVWAIEIAYVNLPANSKGIRGWFMPDQCQKQDQESFQLARVYVGTETQAQELHGTPFPDLFCVETCVEALNLAKLVYNNCTSGMEFNESVNFENKNVPIVDYIYIPHTDTHCIIASGKDRVYVCFRGTKSLKNIKTDLKSSTTPADEYFKQSNSLHCAKYIPKSTKKKREKEKGGDEADDDMSVEEIEVSFEEDDGEDDDDIPQFQPHTLSRGQSFRESVRGATIDAAASVGLGEVPKITGTRVHSGFLKAYLGSRRKIFATLRKHLKKEHETVFVVGHSLGGALTTLFAYDLAHRKSAASMADKKIIAYTFGSPRVGNRRFHNHYNNLVPVTWRVVNAQDIVTQIPLGRMGFKHIGVMVLLDRNGNLLVDPSFIERSWSHRTVASSGAYHLGGVYIQNLSLCIENLNNKDFKPEFWERKLDVDEEEEQEEDHQKSLKVMGLFKKLQSATFTRSGPVNEKGEDDNENLEV